MLVYIVIRYTAVIDRVLIIDITEGFLTTSDFQVNTIWVVSFARSSQRFPLSYKTCAMQSSALMM